MSKKNPDFTPSSDSDGSDSSDNENSDDDDQNFNVQEVNADNLQNRSDNMNENNENEDIEIEHLDENDAYEEVEVAAQFPEPPPQRPQREAKVAAYRDRIWLRDEQDDDDVMDQIDGHLITPESLTPNTSPEKQNNEVDDHMSNSTTSSKNLEWDNYCSSPDLTGYPWEFEETFIESPINTRVYFNRNIDQRIPIKPRLRFKSLSESDVHHIQVDVEDHSGDPLPVPVSQSPPPTSCFPTRVFFNRIRKSFRFRSKSNNELSSSQNF